MKYLIILMLLFGAAQTYGFCETETVSIGGGSTPVDPPETEDPHAGYSNQASLDYVRAKWREQSNWRDELTTTDNYGYDLVDVKVQVDQNNVWPDGNTCVNLYLSDNDTFSTEDTHLGEECDYLRDGKSAGEDEENFYFDNVYVAGHLTNGESYLFVEIVFANGETNRSSKREDPASRKESVKIIYDESQMMNELNMPIGWTDLTTSCEKITGWAYDPNSEAEPIWVHVYRDGVYIGAALANQSRPDIISRVPTTNHGWTFNIPQHFRDGKPHTFQVFAINDSGHGPNPALEHKDGVTNFTLHCGPVGTVPLYRIEIKAHKRMLLTTSTFEAQLGAPWENTGHIGWVYPSPRNGTGWIRRAYRATFPYGHILTKWWGEYVGLQGGWVLENGLSGRGSFAAYHWAKTGTVPIHRLFNDSGNAHGFARSHELGHYRSRGFRDEGKHLWVYPAY